MSNLLNALVPAIGWSLLHFVWQGLLIGWAASLAFQLLRNRRPQVRYALACAALLLCAALPLAGIATRLADQVPAASASLLPPPENANGLPSALAGQGVTPLPAPPSAAPPGTPAPFAAAMRAAMGAVLDEDQLMALDYTLRRQLPWLVLLWAGGAALMTLRLSLGLQWVKARTLPGHYHADPQWQARLTALAQRFGLRRPVRLGVSGDELDGPMTAGVWKPIVLLPASLLSGLPPELIEALLAHELAHIKRHDYLVNLVQSAIEIVLFYHPTVWMLSRRIRAEREAIADDLAASTLGEPRRLALALSELDKFQFSTSHFAAPAAHGGDLMSRIKRLMRPDAEPLSWKLAAPLLGLCAACVVLYAHASPAPDAISATGAPSVERPDADVSALPVPAPSASPAADPAPAAAPSPRRSDTAGHRYGPPPAPPAPPAPLAPPAPPVPRTLYAQAAVPAVPAIPAPAAPAAAVRNAPPAPPAVPAPPAPPPLPAPSDLDGDWSHYHVNEDNRRLSYVVVRDGKNISMTGRRGDWEEVRKVKANTQGDFLWVRKDGKSYLIQDPATLAKVNEAWKPVEAMAAKMEAEGRTMEVHSKEMEKLGAQIEKAVEEAMGSREQRAANRVAERKIESIGRQQERIGREMEKLARRMESADDAQRKSLDEQMRALQAKMAPLQAEMAQASQQLAEQHSKLDVDREPMNKLHQQMAEAGKPMKELGRKMGELGREQGRLSREADKTVRSLIDDAITSGRAKPVL